MDVPAKARRRLAPLLVAGCMICSLSCDDGNSGPDGDDLDVDSNLTIWANLMPTFPPLDDPIHALVEAEFHNLSDEAVAVRVVKMFVRSTDDGRLLHVFGLEQVTDWDGYLMAGSSGSGEWRKGIALLTGRFVCDESVVGTLWFTARSAEGDLLQVSPIDLEPTTLACVY